MSEIETGTEHLLATTDDGVAVLTFNRPERRNALSWDMIDALASMLRRFELDDDVGCIVLTGSGGAFCAGGDVKDMAAGSFAGGGNGIDGAIARQRLSHRETAGRLFSMPKPTIASLPGPAAGAGLSLALACDLRFAAAGTFITTAFAKVGFSGDFGGTWFLTRLVGLARAKELYYFSERLPVEEAERLGIVNRVVPGEDLEEETMARARQLADGPRIAYAYMKENLNRAVRAELGECLDLEATHHLHTGATPDHKEAVAAFVEHREPRFRRGRPT